MPANRKTVRPPSLTAPLSRLLLQCRYDFQNRIWNLPDAQTRRNDRLSFSNSQAGLLPLLPVVIAEFSDPSLGGANPSNSATAGLESGLHSRGLRGKPKQQERKNET